SKESECRNQQEQPQQAAKRGVRSAKDDRDHHKTITCDHRADAVSDKFVGVLASPSDQCLKAITALATVPLGFLTLSLTLQVSPLIHYGYSFTRAWFDMFPSTRPNVGRAGT